MFKRAAVIVSIALAVGAAGMARAADAEDDGDGDGAASSSVLRFEVVDDIAAARAAGAWPVREYEPVPLYQRPKAARHRKQYPNVMGVRFADWLAAHDAASSARLASEVN